MIGWVKLSLSSTHSSLNKEPLSAAEIFPMQLLFGIFDFFATTKVRIFQIACVCDKVLQKYIFHANFFFTGTSIFAGVLFGTIKKIFTI